jgi:hypothetical protein
MLRFLTLLSLRLLAVLAAAGLLIAQSWGWSEYASPELYLIHWAQVGPQGQWLIVPASGGTSQPLTFEDRPIRALDCSPDGRTLALLTSRGEIHVMTGTGTTYERRVEAGYSLLTLANDGSLALYEPSLGGLRMAGDTVEPLAAPEADDLRYTVSVGADGWQMWNSELNVLQFVTPTGTLVRSIFPVSAGHWLADERLVSFGTLGNETRQYLIDTPRPALVTLKQAPGIYAPDGLTRAVALRDDPRGSYRTYIGGAFGDVGLKPIPRAAFASDWPVCWLAFWPELESVRASASP